LFSLRQGIWFFGRAAPLIGGRVMTITRTPRRSEEERLVTANELADRWGVHRDSVYRIPQGQLPYLKLGPRTRRYRWVDVVDYEQARRVG
jgi:hypothetical protein